MTKSLKGAASYIDKNISFEELSLETYLSTDNILENKRGKVRAEKLPSYSKNIRGFNKDDILISNIRPYLKKIWIADHSGGCSSDILVLKINEEYIPKFIFYALTRDDFFRYVMNGSKGTRMPRGDKNHILEFPIPSFDKETQIRITKVLSDIDYKIELNNKIITELEAMAKLIYDYWFMQFDFPDENGKPYKSSGGKMVYSEELKREIPKGWESKCLSQFIDVGTETIDPASYPHENFGLYSISSYDKYKSFEIKLAEDVHSGKFCVDKECILVSKLNPKFLRVIFATKDNLFCSTEFVVWKSRNSAFKSFQYMIAVSASFRAYCLNGATGTSNSHKRVQREYMMDFKVPFQTDLVQRFGDLLNAKLTKINRNITENKELIKLRDWLLPMLMNDQIKVR